MLISEVFLYQLAKMLSSSEVAHSDDMKSALETDESYAEYRLSLVAQVTDAAEKYGVAIKDKVVLDLGCLDGAISLGYLDYGARRVIGVDIDTDAITVAKKYRANDRAEFYESSIDGIPLEDNSVDTILCFDVFEHVEEPGAMLEEIGRVLKPGGQLLVGTWGWKHPFAPHLWSTMPVPYAHIFFSERTVLRACKRVYESDWYKPTLHDFDDEGNRKLGKYDHEEIPSHYLNKLLVSDFEQIFKDSSLDYKMNPQAFGSRLASWTKAFLNVPWIREYIIGYLWVVVTKPSTESNSLT